MIEQVKITKNEEPAVAAQSQLEKSELRPWHQLELKRLSLSLNTANGGSSGSDGNGRPMV